MKGVSEQREDKKCFPKSRRNLTTQDSVLYFLQFDLFGPPVMQVLLVIHFGNTFGLRNSNVFTRAEDYVTI